MPLEIEVNSLFGSVHREPTMLHIGGVGPTMLNVLIADSHPIARAGLQTLVERVAERLGDECLIAISDDALTAFRKAKRLQPDLIVLSSNLRLTGGIQDVLALRAYAPSSKLLIIGDGEDMAAGDYEHAGANAILSKRDSPAAIEAALLALLGRPAGRAPDNASGSI